MTVVDKSKKQFMIMNLSEKRLNSTVEENLYRVVFRDLHTENLTAERLAKLEKANPVK